MAARHALADKLTLAPAWHVSRWFNTTDDLTIDALRGKAVALFAFQMLCPGCVAQSIPQAKELAATFASDDLAVIGFHTVFEHHSAMTPASLEAFLHEYRVRFPVAVDAPGERGSPLPKTMAAYEMQGTPTLVLIDRDGRRRFQSFGHVPDLQLGAAVASLLAKSDGASAGAPDAARAGASLEGKCVDGTCSV